ncbi:tyrosine-type recombinase/integrase [Paludibaculum fermentans]|uniref:tyrosine-type recombinase/integrase n=1 Tax=Paludibaculum fermentans TaxID=1473598 RepID=UPI003EB70D10
MLNLFRRHLGNKKDNTGCSLAGTRSKECPSKPKCPIHFEGIDGQGQRRKPQALIDPATGSGVRDWGRAVEIIRELELPKPPNQQQAPKVSLQDAIATFLKSKSGISSDDKYVLILRRLAAYMELQKRTAVEEVTLVDLVNFRATWTGKNTTQRRDQGIIKGFFGFCVDADYIVKNPAAKLSPIPKTRPQTDPFEPEEMRRIFAALSELTDEYGRKGQAIADQTKAFVYVMRYTGLSIGDVAKLEKAHVQGNRIMTYRKKTNEEVFAAVPPFVIHILNAAPHDSDRYFFWTGNGKIHTRTSKWGARLQRLFVLAGVRIVEVEKVRRSGGVLKDSPELVKVSEAVPHMFRHTLVRDLLTANNPVPMEEIAELLGDKLETVREHYSKWDRRRQARLESHLTDFWSNDKLTNSLTT